MDIRDTKDVGYTFDFIARNDWIVVEENKDTEEQ